MWYTLCFPRTAFLAPSTSSFSRSLALINSGTSIRHSLHTLSSERLMIVFCFSLTVYAYDYQLYWILPLALSVYCRIAFHVYVYRPCSVPFFVIEKWLFFPPFPFFLLFLSLRVLYDFSIYLAGVEDIQSADHDYNFLSAKAQTEEFDSLPTLSDPLASILVHCAFSFMFSSHSGWLHRWQ